MEPPGGDPLPGFATPEVTRAFASEHQADGFYLDHQGLLVSTLGMGTYIGEATPEASRAYEEAAVSMLDGGVNVLDTAVNYRGQASERDLGRALRSAGVDRRGVLVATKGGFVAPDAASELSPQEWLHRELIDSGLVEPEDIIGGMHCMTPGYLRDQLDRSLSNLGLEAVDVYHVHNPETQLQQGVPREVFEERLRQAFLTLEAQVDAGRIGRYGVATWDGLRVGPEERAHLGLERLLELAAEARGLFEAGAQEATHEAAAGVEPSPQHGFGAVQLPLNLAMTEAAAERTQPWQGERVAALEAAAEAGLMVFTSASLLQARLLGQVPEAVRHAFSADHDLAACLEFARSAGGAHTALVGNGSPEHARANVEAVRGRGAPRVDEAAKLAAL